MIINQLSRTPKVTRDYNNHGRFEIMLFSVSIAVKLVIRIIKKKFANNNILFYCDVIVAPKEKQVFSS